jgi:hypothetical protein
MILWEKMRSNPRLGVGSSAMLQKHLRYLRKQRSILHRTEVSEKSASPFWSDLPTGVPLSGGENFGILGGILFAQV